MQKTIVERTVKSVTYAAPPVKSEVLDRAVTLHQQRRMTLGDALVAATALVHRLPPVTHNVDGFSWIEDLTIVDPLDPAWLDSG